MSARCSPTSPVPKIDAERPNVPARWRPTGRKIWLEFADGRGEEANEWNWHRNAPFLANRGTFSKLARPHKGMTVWRQTGSLAPHEWEREVALVLRREQHCTHLPAPWTQADKIGSASLTIGVYPVEPCLQCYALQRLGVPLPDASGQTARG